jgi:hypothetical protein
MLVIHGWLRRQTLPSGACSTSQRTLRARVSSMPTIVVGCGSGSRRASSATTARCTVHQANAVLAGDVGDGPVGLADRGGELLAKPLGHAGPAWHLLPGLGE